MGLVRMSHVPLISRNAVPKLHAPRRGPQVVCVCLLVVLALLLVPSLTQPFVVSNATRPSTDPFPAAVLRVMDASTQHRLLTEDTFQDLLAAVSYLAEREMHPR
jgi:hypothetical protein